MVLAVAACLAQAADYAFMDPFAAGEQFYQQMQPFFQEEEDKARTAWNTSACTGTPW